jgi:hypothetical protein
MATPLIKPLNVQGGTFYVLPSAALDISRTFSDDNFRFVFSKFACLDVPTFRQPQDGDNSPSFQAIGNDGNTGATGTSWDPTVITDMINGVQQNNVYLANNFENYVLNWENLVLNETNSDGNDYNDSIQTTVSERIFWKWMTNMGALRFQDARSTVTSSNNLYEEETENLDNTATDVYRRVVKYLGDIDIVNNIKQGGQAYTEVYLHIPTSHGSTPDVLFNVVNDSNYSPTLSWTGTNGDDIEGRTSHINPSMSITAYFDDNSTNIYSTGNVFGDASNKIIEAATDIAGSNVYDINISNMDGAVIDWNTSDYKKINDDSTIQLLSEFNATALSEDFNFNVVLVYYDIYNVSNPSETSRNLYGVLFIDDFQETIADGATIKKFSKFKPNPVTKLNGNSYGLKLNVKFDTSADNVGVEKIINEYNTFSMDLYSDAMISLQNSLEMFQSQSIKLSTLTEEVKNLESFYFNQATIDELQKSVKDLEEVVNNAQIALESPSTLIELINNNTKRINSLAAGELTEDLTYNVNTFSQGAGIKIDKSVPNKLIFENIVQKYNTIGICYNDTGYFSYVNGNGITDETNINYATRNNIINIGRFGNYFKNKTPDETVTNDVRINLDDRTFKWKTGKSYKIVFENEINIDTFSEIIFYTDGSNVFKQGAWNWLVGKFTKNDLLSNKPIFEIICVDATKYIFEIDILR